MKHCDKIMIVEDDAGIRHYLQSTLSNAGYDTVAVGDGRSALALAASHCPDCGACPIWMALASFKASANGAVFPSLSFLPA